MNHLKLILFLLLASVTICSNAQPKSKYVVYDETEIVLQNARIVDVVKGIVLEGHSLHISKGRIVRIGRTGTIHVPVNARIIELSGKTILPGLVMLHEHMNYNNGAGVWQFHPVSFPKLYLAKRR